MLGFSLSLSLAIDIYCHLRSSLFAAFFVFSFFPAMFAAEEERKMVHSSRINFDHPYYDDVDEYYLGLCNEAEYEKEASNPREKEFGDSFKLLTIAERHQFLKTQTSRVFVPKKRRGSGGLGFTSMIKTQCTDQKAKSTTGSIDESGSPLGAILVPEKRRASRRKFVRKNNHCIMSTDQEDDLTAKMKSNQEKKTAGYLISPSHGSCQRVVSHAPTRKGNRVR
ncbi:hypothetical protein OIU84_003149 [Salix udensis]|uniref:Uncharacterized protein n=1 Tax=Salix udensis TaxID=889485 RepID=A0AAD6K5T0_9ROSI|nr:hypothetical protein OIU84_003149 [Salix udensis]